MSTATSATCCPCSPYFEVTTDTGSYRVEKSGIAANQWHKVAARVDNNQLQLFVDDFSQPETVPYSGTLQYSGNLLKIGGDYYGQLQDLRYYDQSTAPVLRIVDATDNRADNHLIAKNVAFNETGKATLRIATTGQFNVSGQTLDLAYVNAVFSSEGNNEGHSSRTHIPLISEQGFKDITGAAANIGLIGPAIAQLDPNNIDYLAHADPWSSPSQYSLIPVAHAWGWVDTLDLFIPITSIQDVIEQIGYIGTEDFNPVILIVSGLDVALIFSGPFKPALSIAFKPLKKLAANPAALKVIKILGPFFGNVIQKVSKSRSIDPIINLLPFFMILGEIAADEEARQAIPIIIDAISSSEDLQTWFDYFRLPTEGWEGDEIPQVQLDLAAAPEVNSLPLSGIMNQAYASKRGAFKRRGGVKAGKELIQTLKDLSSGSVTPEEAARRISSAMRGIVNAASSPTVIKDILTNRQTLVAAAAIAANGSRDLVQNLLGKDRGNRTSRTPLFLQIAAIAYFESRFSKECQEYCIKTPDIREPVRTLYTQSFRKALVEGWASAQESGYQFHLTMAALMHLWGEMELSPYGKLQAIESEVEIPFFHDLNGEIKVFTKSLLKRRVDLVTQVEGEERPRFIEVKSYSGQQGDKGNLKAISDSNIKGKFTTWNMTKTSTEAIEDTETGIKLTDGGNHRQYLLDKIASTNNFLIKDPLTRNEMWKAKKIHWFFQSYKQITVGGFTPGQIKLAAHALAAEPKNQPTKKLVNISLGAVPYNKRYNLQQAKSRAEREIQLFNIKTILTNSGSQVVEKLFDMANLTPEDKARVQAQVEQLILTELP